VTAETVPDPLAHVREHNPYAGQGSVLLDIGDGVGALVVTMPWSMVGEEVEIDADDPGLAHALSHEHGHAHSHSHSHEPGHARTHHRPHVAVLPRPVPGGGETPSLVFPSLAAGTYRLYEKGGDVAVTTAAVVDGRVTAISWPD
jgi:hypothetical protein